MKLKLLACFLLLGQMALAQEKTEGSHIGGGGDYLVEDQMFHIRGKIKQWIEESDRKDKGGARELKFRSGMNFEIYKTKMLGVLEFGKVKPYALTLSEENDPSNLDPFLKVEVDGAKKTCRSFEKKSVLWILCNVERFNGLSPAKQYRQMHHEFAVLAGVEENSGAASDYFYSDQITDYVEAETTFRLSLEKQRKALGPRQVISENEGIESHQCTARGWIDDQNKKPVFTECRIDFMLSYEFSHREDGHTNGFNFKNVVGGYLCRYATDGKNADLFLDSQRFDTVYEAEAPVYVYRDNEEYNRPIRHYPHELTDAAIIRSMQRQDNWNLIVMLPKKISYRSLPGKAKALITHEKVIYRGHDGKYYPMESKCTNYLFEDFL